MTLELDNLLDELEAVEIASSARTSALVQRVARRVEPRFAVPRHGRLPRLAYLLQTEATHRAHGEGDPSRLTEGTVELFASAFRCWDAVAALSADDATPNDNHAAVTEVAASELDGLGLDEDLSPYSTLALFLAATGLVSRFPAETRLSLERFQLVRALPEDTSWPMLVSDRISRSIALLARKGNGWRDIDEAIGLMAELRDLQSTHEADYLGRTSTPDSEIPDALALVGLYHVAQAVTTTGAYLSEGTQSIATIRIRLDNHSSQATQAFIGAGRPGLAHFARLVSLTCHVLCGSSVWSHLAGLGSVAQNLLRQLTSRDLARPVLELWPSQQEALGRGLLDPYPRAIVVEMPTSAGKTLLAKFVIAQTKGLSPEGRIAYLVPTRALANQITRELRMDFGELGWTVEQAVPAFDLNPTEDTLLALSPDILVATPEKFDLLVKRRHQSVENLALVVADEAHNIADSTRGSRLELVLGTAKRDYPNARFLLLSPFLPNGGELAEWLGDDRAGTPIQVSWKPGQRIVGYVAGIGRGADRATSLTCVPSVDAADLPDDLMVPIGPRPGSSSIKELTRCAVEGLKARGTTLVLCRGKGTSMTRARELATDCGAGEEPNSERALAVRRFLRAEAGAETLLARCIERRVAFHHGGVSHEARWLVERLIVEGDIDIVCGTTTLAQGINFPIRSVILETLKKGDVELTHHDFWNIAGRAGRALVDSAGVVGFVAGNASKQTEFRAFLRKEAEVIGSIIAGILSDADLLAAEFNLKTVRDHPQLADLMRFLAHAMRVAGQAGIASELEEVLRASLVFHQVRQQGGDRADALISICRAYLTKASSYPGGVLTLSDSTGFATPSVLALLSRKSQSASLANRERWQPSSLFGEDTSLLRERVEAVADLPEMRLGEGHGRPLDTERVAQILRDWVSGSSLGAMASAHELRETGDEDSRLASFSSYLFGTLLGHASWGLGALEGVCKGESDWADAEFVPSMVFFGVPTKEAVWLRMVGVPRVSARILGRRWSDDVGSPPQSFSQMRNWVDALDEQAWGDSLPEGSQMEGSDAKEVWRLLSH